MILARFWPEDKRREGVKPPPAASGLVPRVSSVPEANSWSSAGISHLARAVPGFQWPWWALWEQALLCVRLGGHHLLPV